SSRRASIELTHRADIRHESGKFACTVPARRHRRTGNARLDKPVQIAVRGCTPELAAAQVDAGDRIAVRSVTRDAVRVVKIEARFDVSLRELADPFLSLNLNGSRQQGHQDTAKSSHKDEALYFGVTLTVRVIRVNACMTVAALCEAVNILWEITTRRSPMKMHIAESKVCKEHFHW